MTSNQHSGLFAPGALCKLVSPHGYQGVMRGVTSSGDWPSDQNNYLTVGTPVICLAHISTSVVEVLCPDGVLGRFYVRELSEVK